MITWQYIAALIDRCTSIHITKNVKRLGVFILEPAIEISLINNDISKIVSDFLTNHNISNGISTYNVTKGGVKFKTSKVRIYKNEHLLTLINNVYPFILEKERIDVLLEYVKTREEKKLENKKARYGITELNLYKSLKSLNDLHYNGYNF